MGSLTIPYKIFAVTLWLLVLTGCAKVDYYTQSIRGHAEVLLKSRPIVDLLADTRMPPQLKEKLALALKIRGFASSRLGLPDNGSYRSYADLKRQYVVWNVFAAPELSTEPKEWCFPIVGCVAYRGYFDRHAAESFAATLHNEGWDVYVAGVPAYSTLGWFDDPVLNTVIRQREEDLAGLIFHELAHQMVYIKGDSSFNESFATVVELEGTRRWFGRQGVAQRAKVYRLKKERGRQVVDLVMGYRRRLEKVYAGVESDAWKRSNKTRLFIKLKRDYRHLKREWDGYSGYDHWFSQDLNNAHLASIGTYHQYVPAFRRLLAQFNGDLAKFYRAVAQLGRLPKAVREAKLNAMVKPTRISQVSF